MSFARFCVAAYVWFQQWWIWANKTLAQAAWVVPPVSEQTHKVVIIGDDFAEGMGDYVTFMGIAGVVRHLKHLIGCDATIKMNWRLYNCGKCGSTSADWLPEKPLFKSTFSHKAFKDAEIIMIWLGVNDCRSGPKHQFPAGTVKSLSQICDALRKDGKRVIIAGLPCTGSAKVNEEEGLWNKEANKLLAEYVTSATDDGLEFPLNFGPMLNGPKFSRDHSIGFDKEHFNSAGYKLAAKDVYETLHRLRLLY